VLYSSRRGGSPKHEFPHHDNADTLMKFSRTASARRDAEGEKQRRRLKQSAPLSVVLKTHTRRLSDKEDAED
jgi:hypothetical protein